MGITFALATLGWIFFRADSIGQAFAYIGNIFSKSLIFDPFKSANAVFILPLLFIMIAVEWLQRDKQHGLDFDNRKIPAFVRIFAYYALIAVIIQFGSGQQSFIYFKF